MAEPSAIHIKLNESWKHVLLPEFEQPYMHSLRDFLARGKRDGREVYPPGDQIFNALNSTNFEQVKIVILGQDPYHGPGQAHGLCFSVRPGVAIPPSLLNIFKELHADLGVTRPAHGCLVSWAEQGVLLLNAVLTVEAGKAASHQGKGWERFTDGIVNALNDSREHLVFMLWGAYAQKKGALIDRQKHLVLESPHPSPLSASRGFLGNRHFSKANRYLRETGQKEINWTIADQVTS